MAGMLNRGARKGARRTIVITGGSSGLGRATALEFARRGWNVALIARSERALRAAQAEVEAEGGRALILPLDVADAAAVEAAADRVAALFGGIDVWVNGAAVSAYAPIDETTPEEFRRIVEVNLLGSVHGIRAALKHMKPRDRGHIVQVGSVLSQRAIPLQGAYCGTKYGIRGVLDALNAELRHDGSRIRTTIVQPPGMNTPFFDHALNKMDRKPMPTPPVYQPELAARAIVQAVRTKPRELWVGGITAGSAVGHVLAPGLMDWMAGKAGVQGQKSSERRQPGERNNLFATADVNGGQMHGRFDEQALADGAIVSPLRVRTLLGLAGITAIAGLTALAMQRRRAGGGAYAGSGAGARAGSIDRGAASYGAGATLDDPSTLSADAEGLNAPTPAAMQGQRSASETLSTLR